VRKSHGLQRRFLPEAPWRHTSIILRPDTTALGYESMIFTKEKSKDVKVIAELVAVLG